MSLSKSKFLYSNNCLQFLKRAVPLYSIPLNCVGPRTHLEALPVDGANGSCTLEPEADPNVAGPNAKGQTQGWRLQALLDPVLDHLLHLRLVLQKLSVQLIKVQSKLICNHISFKDILSKVILSTVISSTVISSYVNSSKVILYNANLSKLKSSKSFVYSQFV